ncbi:helix-turn-helix domain-containing protein [Pseudomonas sp. NPDC078700]|uniref:winged helix-turn-helix domain-containing protein n=1 Tax=Pseudomonas sp. NPDC078700 TaxID=3364424 RepID=UPI0037C68418
MVQEISKTKSSFYRRLYVAWLIDTGSAASIPALMATTGMPRRTAQDTLNALAELDITCEFEQEPGSRNNAGHYVIRDWGAIDKGWIDANIQVLKQALNYP